MNKCKGYEKDRKIFVEIHKLRKAILANVMNYRPVIAVHNNSPGSFDINWYAARGREEEKGNTRESPGNPAIHKNEDPDDFFLVTMVEDFNRIKGKYNVVLQSRHNDSTRGLVPRRTGRCRSSASGAVISTWRPGINTETSNWRCSKT